MECEEGEEEEQQVLRSRVAAGAMVLVSLVLGFGVVKLCNVWVPVVEVVLGS